MPSTDLTRRRTLTVGCLTFVGLAGCLADGGDTDANAGSTGTTNDSNSDEAQTDSTPPGEISPVELAVTDFVEYPLAGVHPHVHARRETQYVVVSVDSSLDDEAVRERLGLQLDGQATALADRQPVPWESNTTDVAFAVSKGDQYETGAVIGDGMRLHSLSETTLERLNRPPRFHVSDLSVSPAELHPDEQTTATVRATVENAGEGTGTFGASLKGNYVSGSKTVTVTLDAGTTAELEATTRVVGDGDEAPVRLDWGRDEWETEIPVGEAETGAVTTTAE
ncbi:hypothetical protein [Haloferax sp. YSMS24]|uniref:hypothetical protein n=1 Tax=Haloferax sp. YSMS24 TaxID=3388425 RepID=UPI00398D2DF6